jgi:hypothetical protein
VDGTTVPEQRCLVHTLQYVSTNRRSERTGEKNQELRTRLLEHAAAVSQADTAADADVSGGLLCAQKSPP